jgi:hypothetical protein
MKAYRYIFCQLWSAVIDSYQASCTAHEQRPARTPRKIDFPRKVLLVGYLTGSIAPE